jgi:hypothetical protein
MSDNVLRVQNVNSRLVSTDDVLKGKLYRVLRARPKNYWAVNSYKRKIWDGWKSFFNEKTGLFMTGLLPEVQLAIRTLDRSCELIDETNRPSWLHQNIDDAFLDQWRPNGYDPLKLHDFQPDFVNKIIKYNRGIVKAPTGCHRKGQKVVMYDGSLKCVEDVVVGDTLLGADSKPRHVLKLCRGKDLMYEIAPVKGSSFVVNQEHVLTLVKTTSRINRYPCDKGGVIVDVKISEYVKWSKWKKHIHKLIRSNAVCFAEEKQLPLDPYFMGVILGDGSIQYVPGVTTKDKEIIRESRKQAKNFGLKLVKTINKKRCPTYFLVGKKGKTNPFADLFRKLDLWGKKCGDKFIPNTYKVSSVNERLNLLAGIIDTDGHLSKGYYDIITKSSILADDIAFVARSLGFAAYVKPCRKKAQTGPYRTYFRISIGGNINLIPCKIKRKQAKPRRQKKSVLRTGFKTTKLKEESYYGFTLDGDQRYLLDDFTITHNSGKTFVLISTIHSLPPKTPILFLTKGKQLVKQNYDEMKAWGVENLGLWCDGYKQTNYIMCATIHTATFDALEKLLPKFKVIFVDEVHDGVSDVPIKAYRKMVNAAVRIGFSATPFRYDKKKIDKVHQFTVKGHFGPVLKTSTTDTGFLTTGDLQERGILSTSNCTVYKVTSPNLAYEPYQDAISLGIEQNFEFHKNVVRLARSRPGRTLVIVERIAQGEYLHQLMPEASWIQGKDSLAVREPVIQALLKGDKCCAIVMRHIITAGINIRIHNLINASGGQAAHNLIQQLGRGLRPAGDKETLEYYDFLFTINPYLWRHSEWRIEVLQNEGHKVTIKEDYDF